MAQCGTCHLISDRISLEKKSIEYSIFNARKLNIYFVLVVLLIGLSSLQHFCKDYARPLILCGFENKTMEKREFDVENEGPALLWNMFTTALIFTNYFETTTILKVAEENH